MKPLNIFFSVDKNYLIHFAVTLTSVLENNKNLKISVYVIHDLEDISLLEQLSTFFYNKYGVKLYLTELDNKIFSNFYISDYISKATYFRLLFAEIIPENVLSGLSLDCDTIVTGSLSGLVDMNFFNENEKNEYSLLAVSDKGEAKEIERFNKLGFDTRMYFNAGVMLLNLKKWRIDKASDGLIKIAEEYKKELVWHDQDVLNIYFKNNCGKLESTYNSFTEEKMSKLPLIIHFSGSSKPWHFYNNHPYKSLYWKYLKMTPFKNEKFEKVTLKKILKKSLRILNTGK